VPSTKSGTRSCPADKRTSCAWDGCVAARRATGETRGQDNATICRECTEGVVRCSIRYMDAKRVHHQRMRMVVILVRRQIQLTAILAFAFGTLACSDPTSPSGQQSLTNTAIINPAWSADGREVVYTARFVVRTLSFTLNAVNVSSGAVRTIAVTTGTNTGGELVVAPSNGGYVFLVAAAIGPEYVIYNVPVSGRQLDTVAADARSPWFQVSSDGRLVAYHSGDGMLSPSASDSLKIVDGSGSFGHVVRNIGTTASVGAMWSFSPVGASLVYSDGGVKKIDVATGVSTLLYSAPSSPATNARELVVSSVRWEGSNPHLLVATWIDKQGPTSIYDLNGSTGVRTLVGSVPEAERSPWNMTWSPDGSQVAVWVSTKSFNCSVEGCSYDGRLYLLTKGTAGSRTLYDTLGAAASPRWTAFSPDGRSVGTVLWFGLRVSRCYDAWVRRLDYW